MELQKILIWQLQSSAGLLEALGHDFTITSSSTLEETLQLAAEGNQKALVVDLSSQVPLNLECYKGLLEDDEIVENLPLIIISSSGELRHKLEAFEQGCDDYIEPGTSPVETAARINKSIYYFNLFFLGQ